MFDKPAFDIEPSCLEEISGKNFAVAVSGGGDSLALLYAIIAMGLRPMVYTVDHQLRENSHVENQFVLSLAQGLGCQAVILSPKIEFNGNLQENARRARYDAMTQQSRIDGIEHVLLAHNADDQIETFFMNAMRGSGVDGMSAMPVRQGTHPVWLRPLLNVSRENLRQYLRTMDVKWIDDPSNENERFTRIKIRNWIRLGHEMGLDFSKMPRSIENLARVSGELKTQSSSIAQDLIQFSKLNIEAVLDRDQLSEISAEFTLRILSALVRYYGMGEYPPRRSALDGLCQELKNQRGGCTLGGAQFSWEGNKLRVHSEAAALPPASISHIWRLWKWCGQWRDGDQFGALGDHAKNVEFWRDWGISYGAARTMPMLWRDQQILDPNRMGENIQLCRPFCMV